MSDKLYLSAQQLLEDSFELGAQIIRDGFRPTIIIAIWRGGTPMGIAVQELLAWFGIETDHIAIRTSSYRGIDGRSDEIRIHGMNYLIKNCCREDRLLIVDDVFDTGLTIQSVIAYLGDR
ncbi:MAG: hypoxanthine phosphoribosyltransferase, partial [Gammaproteobacteria bacterium]